MLHTSPGEHGNLATAGKQLGLETILAIMQILDQTLTRLRYSTQGRTLAEMALVRIADLENLSELAEVIAELRDRAPAGGSAPAPPAARTAPSTTTSAAKKKRVS